MVKIIFPSVFLRPVLSSVPALKSALLSCEGPGLLMVCELCSTASETVGNCAQIIKAHT